MNKQASSLNDEYLLSRAIFGAPPHPVLLDFGCGQGRLVARGLARRLDIYGVDTFEGNYETWPQTLPAETLGRIRVITNGKIPFDDESFDLVISNQVFEHTVDPRQALAEIHRVLKPGGKFIAIFPHYGVWFEGHVGLYCAHWMRRFPRLQYMYLQLCHTLGLGYYRESGVAGWAHILKHVVFYHRQRDIESWWSDAFGRRPESMAHDWMAFRIAASPRLTWLAPWATRPWLAAPLTRICAIRAGLVLEAVKSPLQ